jgi:hypothetical protein
VSSGGGGWDLVLCVHDVFYDDEFLMRDVLI